MTPSEKTAALSAFAEFVCFRVAARLTSMTEVRRKAAALLRLVQVNDGVRWAYHRSDRGIGNDSKINFAAGLEIVLEHNPI